MTGNISLICVNLPIYEDNTTFCGIVHIWSPRISKTYSLIACLVPTFFAWFFTAIIILKSYKPLYKVYKNNLSPKNRFEDRSLNENIKGRLREDVSIDKAFITKETTTTGISTNINQIVKVDLTDPSDNNIQHSSKFEAETKYHVKGKKTLRESNHGEAFEEKFVNQATVETQQLIISEHSNDTKSKTSTPLTSNQNTDLKLKSAELNFIQTPDFNEKDTIEHNSEMYKTDKIISTQPFLDNKNADDMNVIRRNMLKEDFLANNSIEKVTILESAYQFWDGCSCNCTRNKEICCLNFWASISLPQSIRKPFFMFTIVVFTIIKLLWDAADVTIDAYLFYQLEMGEVIDNSIYRNATVNSFILAFSVLGCIKILFWLRIIGLPGDKKSFDN